MSLRDDLLRERLAAYVRLRGGYPIPLAGAIYLAGLAVAGYTLPPNRWTLWAFIMSGSIFPLALLLSKIFRVDFMRDKTAVDDVLFPAFASMLLFWPIAFAAFGSAVQLVPLILAIGMSIHWPVIGWTYGRTGLYTAHAIARALVCLFIWARIPESRFTAAAECLGDLRADGDRDLYRLGSSAKKPARSSLAASPCVGVR